MRRTLSKWLALAGAGILMASAAQACDLRLGARGQSTAD